MPRRAARVRVGFFAGIGAGFEADAGAGSLRDGVEGVRSFFESPFSAETARRRESALSNSTRIQLLRVR